MGTFVIVKAAVIFEVATDTPSTAHHVGAVEFALAKAGLTLYCPVEAGVIKDVDAEDVKAASSI